MTDRPRVDRGLALLAGVTVVIVADIANIGFALASHHWITAFAWLTAAIAATGWLHAVNQWGHWRRMYLALRVTRTTWPWNGTPAPNVQGTTEKEGEGNA